MHKFFAPALAVIVSVLAAAPLVAQGYDKKTTEKMLKDGAKKLASADAAERELGASWMAGYIQCSYKAQYAPTFIKALKDTNPKVKVHAATALVKVQAVEAIPDLIALLEDANDAVREGAAIAIGGMGEAARSAEPALKKAHAAAVSQRKSVTEGTMQEAMNQINGTSKGRYAKCP